MSKDSNLSLERIRKALAKSRDGGEGRSVRVEIFSDGSGYLRSKHRTVELEPLDESKLREGAVDIVDWVEQMLPGPESEPDKIWTTQRFCSLLEDLSEVAEALDTSILVNTHSRVAISMGGPVSYRSPEILAKDPHILTTLTRMNEKAERYRKYLELKEEFGV